MSSAGDRSPQLLNQVPAPIRRRHYSLRTEQAYVQGIRCFILFHGTRHPRDLGAAELTAFLSYLTAQRHVAASTQNQAAHVILCRSRRKGDQAGRRCGR